MTKIQLLFIYLKTVIFLIILESTLKTFSIEIVQNSSLFFAIIDMPKEHTIFIFFQSERFMMCLFLRIVH